MRSNEQHCIPTIKSDLLVAFNIHLTSFFLWNICSDYIPANKIQALIDSDIPFVVVTTNVDKLSKSQLDKALSDLEENYFKGTGIEIIPFSSISRAGKDVLWNKISQVLSSK